MLEIAKRVKAKAPGELRRALRTVLRFVPLGIGSALDFQIFDRISQRESERLKGFVEALAKDLNQLIAIAPRLIKKEFFDTDEFRFILKETLLRSACEHREDKIEAFRPILMHCMIDGAHEQFDRKLFFLEIVDALSTDHLRILRHLFARNRHSPSDAFEPVKNIWQAFSAENEADRNYTYSGLDILANRMLIQTGAIPLKKAPTHGKRRKKDTKSVEYRTIDRSIQSFGITGLGVEFAEFITTPIVEKSRE